MIELADTSPGVNVQPAEYNRLLGYPRDWVLAGRASELADWARAWYAKNGRPWVYARQAAGLEMDGPSIGIEGMTFSSSQLQKTLRDAEAHGVILVAVSAGPELEEEAQRLWRDEQPDSYFFLEVFGSAVVEHLITMAGAGLCAWAEARAMAVLPHYSPGYPEWEINQQQRLLELIQPNGKPNLPGALDVLDSGALRPKKSQLAVFGLTRHIERVRRLTELAPCQNCSFLPCQYRRTAWAETPKYSVNLKALKRWASERLSMEARADGTIDARFRYDGTTCTNMGHPLAFDYKVKLGRQDAGYPILKQQCGPAPGDPGHTMMCRYLDNPGPLMEAIDREKPLSGQRLNDVVSWHRPVCATGCYCDPASREHKWGLVLETIHFALAARDAGRR